MRIDVQFKENDQKFKAEFKELQQVAADREHYTGAYEVTPSTEQQMLETKDLVMDDDVTVKKIPFYEVTNAAGGTTVTIGREV